MLADAGSHFGGNVLESSIAEVFVDEARVLEGLAGIVAFNFRIYVSIDLEKVLPAIVVVVEKAAAPGDVLVVNANSGGKGNIVECSIRVVVVEIAGVIGKIRFENVEPAVTVVVGHSHTHSGLLMAILAIGATCDHGDIRERAVVIVVEEDARLRIDGDINIRPAIVVEVVGNGRDGIARAGLQDTGLFGGIGESSISVVVIKEVGVSRKTARAAHGGNAFPLANGRLGGRRSFFGIEFYVVADEKIEVTIAVVVEPSAARAPANLFVVNAGFAGDISKRSISVVVK